MVYLKGPGLSPLYVTTPDQGAATQFVGGAFGTGSSTIERGSSTQQSINKIGAKGYTEICLNINGHEECGFGKVSSSFTLNWANDQITGADARTNITSAAQCVPEVSTTSAALGSLVTPETYGMLSTGIIRVCNPTIPTAEPYRWASVGVCGVDDATGLDRGTCWLDKNSVSIKDALLNEQTQLYLSQNMEGYQFGMMNVEDAKLLLESLNKKRDGIIKELNEIALEGISKVHADLARDPISEAKKKYEQKTLGGFESPVKKEVCSINEKCPEDYFCNTEGLCESNYFSPCLTDASCKDGYSCFEGNCYPPMEGDGSESCEWIGSESGGEFDNCPSGEICVRSVCSKIPCNSKLDCSNILIGLGEAEEGDYLNIGCFDGFCVDLGA